MARTRSTNELDAGLEAGLEQLRARLADEARDPREIAAIADALSAASFPGLLAVLAGSGNARDAARPLGDALLEQVARRLAQRGGAASGVAGDPSTDEVAAQLRELLGNGNGGVAPGNDQLARSELMRAAVAELADQSGLPVSTDDARDIAALLLSGEFYRDAADASAVILRTAPAIPIALLQDVSGVHRLFRLPRALARDLGLGFFEAVRMAGDLLDGELDREPHALRHTLRVLYDIATIERTFEMIRALLAPSNESVRLAIVLYARANGIDLEPDDLDVLRDSVLDTRDPDLGPALVAALKRLEKREGATEARRILRRLAQRAR